MQGAVTYSHNIAVFHQSWNLLALGASAPELAGSVVGGDINGAEGDFVRFEDCLNSGGRCDDVRRPRGQGSVEIEG